MPQYQFPVSNVADWNTLDSFTRGYVEAAFFTECNSDNPELEHMETGDIAPDSLKALAEDCSRFQADNSVDLYIAFGDDYDDEQAGRDFWFTRNGHGVGFWDREQLEETLGERLSEAARKCGSCDLYKGDDDLLYFS